MAEKKIKYLITELPEKLHRALKLAAVKQGTSMKAITEKALQKELRLK